MDITKKKITLPHPNNSTLNIKEKNNHSPKKNSQFSQKSTPLSRKKINLPNLYDLERCHKNCACSLSTL